MRREEILGSNPSWLRLATLDALSTQPPEQRVDRIRRRVHGREAAWLAFAARNRVAPIVAHALLDAFPDAPKRAARLEVHAASERRMAVLMGQLDEVAEALARSGIRLVALKNAGIARGLFGCPACCPMGDVDVLIDRRRFREAHEIVRALGFRLASRSVVEPADIEHGLVSGGTEYVRTVAGEEVWLELQWRPVAGRWINVDQEPDALALLERSVPVPGTAVRVLSPEDNLLQVALHTAKHSFVRAPGLRLHTDVDRILAATPVCWEAFADEVERLNVRAPVFFSLAIANALLGTPVPVGILQRIEPPAWKKKLLTTWIRRVDVFEPDQRKFSRPAHLAFHALLYDDLRSIASALDLTQHHTNPKRIIRRLADLGARFER